MEDFSYIKTIAQSQQCVLNNNAAKYVEHFTETGLKLSSSMLQVNYEIAISFVFHLLFYRVVNERQRAILEEFEKEEIIRENSTSIDGNWQVFLFICLLPVFMVTFFFGCSWA